MRHEFEAAAATQDHHPSDIDIDIDMENSSTCAVRNNHRGGAFLLRNDDEENFDGGFT